ncbi:MAG: hypothetical protein IKJ35_04640 [Clostridia bacterium]|nr:hypothetical protein [Clostridia bacterium]
MKIEQNFEFRKRYSTAHARISGHKDRTPAADELVLTSPVRIFCACDGVVAQTAAKDLISYFKTAFGMDAEITRDASEAAVRIALDADRVSGYMARRIEVSEQFVSITASDERGVAQALYALEDRMNLARVPFLKQGVSEEKPIFSPRMVHSGYGMDVFPDGYLSVCAHYGYDAVLSFVRNKEDRAELADLVKRAAKYGIDVYAYCAIKNFSHPEDEGAKELYADLYGGIFRDAPGLKGIVFVGESVEFASRDEHVECRPYNKAPADGIPTGKPTPGWWPCYDYVDWIKLVRDSIRAESPEADIVFWTYNWGSAPAEYRLALVNTLPTDVTLLVTFEMFQKLHLEYSVTDVRDYTISFAGPGDYFVSEAEVAKRRGIRLYTQCNTAGKTWDFGVVPYEPFPKRWNDRNQKLLEAHEKYGLCGLMESHTYGMNPSFISSLANGTFTEGRADFETRLKEEAKRLSAEEYELVLDAWQALDESHRHYIASSENQYGPYRIGPAFPFCLTTQMKQPNRPDALYGNGIYRTLPVNRDRVGTSPYSLRVRDELKQHKQALVYAKQALAKLKKIKNKSTALKRFVNMVEFIVRCHITALNQKEFYVLRTKLLAAQTREEIVKCADKIEKIVLREIENAKAAIPLVQRDSSIGYEPSMGYQCDEEGIRWKLKHMDYLLNVELKPYKI